MASRKPRPLAPGVQTGTNTARMIRVDHAGEYGAVRIYEGQLAVLENRKDAAKTVAVLKRMREQEQAHLKTFDTLVIARRVRPTALEPVWRVAGFTLGVVTALMGEKAVMACTAAVEEVIDDHYRIQLQQISADPELKETVGAFRADEIAHREEALAMGAEQAPGYRLLSEAIKAGCRVAIAISERL